ncbi:hypothetical protein Leryth_009110 [Lithospermum erythrorhizon]|nr:hypothetical protein Leryth_009110 [Lithospermum erythrorhizon]
MRPWSRWKLFKRNSRNGFTTQQFARFAATVSVFSGAWAGEGAGPGSGFDCCFGSVDAIFFTSDSRLKLLVSLLGFHVQTKNNSIMQIYTQNIYSGVGIFSLTSCETSFSPKKMVISVPCVVDNIVGQKRGSENKGNY